MASQVFRSLSLFCLCGAFSLAVPNSARAEEYRIPEIGVKTSTALVAKVEAPNSHIYTKPELESQAVADVDPGETYVVQSSSGNGWVKVDLGDMVGYLPVEDATLIETTREDVDQSVQTRQGVIDYAMQFLGGRYRYGGRDPHTGVDCSGFTKYVMEHAAGIALNRTSRTQAGQGQTVDVDQARPGDLVFYASGGHIDHVAIYMGNGKIIHASTERTGIKISEWDHRKPVKVVDVIN